LKTLNTSRSVRCRRAGPVTRILLLLSGLACLFVRPSQAIDPHRAMSQYVRDRWGTEQGFPRGPVYAITQTNDGYLWIGVEAGLLRFDGWKFELMHDPSGAFVLSNVLGLAADKDGSLWLSLRDRSLIHYRNGAFEDAFSRAEPPDSITAMSVSRHGELLAAKMQFGAFTYRAGIFKLLAGAIGVPRSPIISVAQTGDDSIWLGTRGTGLFRLKGGITSPITQNLPDPKINCLLPDGVSDLWIGTDNGLIRWSGEKLTDQGIPAALHGLQILAMTKDRDANIWMGTGSNGLLRLNARGLSRLESVKSNETYEAITAVFEDREGNLWVGSANGIERLRDSAFVTYSAPEGVPAGGSNPIFADPENRAWFAPVSGGLWWLQGDLHGKISVGNIDKDIVYSIAGAKNDVWLGRQRGGLTRLRTENGAFTAQTYTKADGLAQNSVYSAYETRDGAVWAGTLSGGVSRLSGKNWTTYTIADGLASNTVASILEGSDGAMWFATPTGLSSLSKAHWQNFSYGEGLPSENINCLLEDSTGVIWAGTTAGLAYRKSSRFEVPAQLPASLREQILGLAEDKYGSFWIATSTHVLRVKRAGLLRGDLAAGDIREFGLTDGLRGVEGVKRHRSVVADSLGRIWFSLSRGISVVDPARLTNSAAPAKPGIQIIRADGTEIERTDSIKIPPGHRRIVFGYSALILSVPERVRFRYKLEGFDRDWSEPASGREAIYTNLGPGSYHFRVMASNPDGVWSPEEAAVAFDVNPAVWQTWWFRAGIILACLLAALAVYRLRLRRLTMELNVRFDERLAERTRIAQELHDTLLQGFLSASMQVHVAADRLPADSQVKPALTRTLQLMRQVIEEGRNAVRGLRSTASAPLDLEHAFARIQDDLAPAECSQENNGEPVNFRVIVEGQKMPLRPLLRDEVYGIGREALINAFRHARAKSIVMECTYSSNRLSVIVRDDGCGIDARLLQSGRDGHWGISGMRERADRIGARLQLWSSPGLGTEVKLTVPGHVAFDGRRKPWLRWLSERYSKGWKRQ
jgi:ligand-binding sensor domain-containing protein/signal transduction histidine kinase